MNDPALTLSRPGAIRLRHMSIWRIGNTPLLLVRLAHHWKIAADPCAPPGPQTDALAWLSARRLHDIQFDTRQDAMRALNALHAENPVPELPGRVPLRPAGPGTWTVPGTDITVRRIRPGRYHAHTAAGNRVAATVNLTEMRCQLHRPNRPAA